MLGKSLIQTLKSGDLFVTGLLLAGIIGSTVLLGTKSGGEMGIIEVDGKTVRRVNLDRPEEFPVQGKLHPAVVRVHSDGLEILDNRCSNPSYHSGRISREGEFRICFPNRVLIRIAGSKRLNSSEPDAVSW